MATSKEYKDFILEQLDLLENITCKAMMGKFLLYYNDVLFSIIFCNFKTNIFDCNYIYYIDYKNYCYI